MNKLSLLIENLKTQCAFIIENPINLKYFTGSNIDTGILVIKQNEVLFFTDSRYIESAKKQILEPIKVVLLNNKKAQLRQCLFDVENIYIETHYQTVFGAKLYNYKDDALLDNLINGLRAVKSPYEIDCIKSAQKLTDAAFSHILNHIKEGVSERQIALELEFFMRKNGAEGVSFDIIAVSGKNSSLPHGIPTDKPISKGDFLTIDMGCKVNGYCSDMTRTVAVGYVTDEMRRVYDIVSKAQQTALDSIKAGAVCKNVDAAARDIITARGYGDCFGHSTGHGVGLYIHEEPRLSSLSDTVLKEGMVVTVEPGIYIEDKFGVRIEDMVVVTENGCENLTGSDKSLIIL
ncbi:MAG: aminopeptidase P family protein [Clostridia bacterium]|nr:aminopeptidase P family protein [Clostridia bacterium]